MMSIIRFCAQVCNSILGLYCVDSVLGLRLMNHEHKQLRYVQPMCNSGKYQKGCKH